MATGPFIGWKTYNSVLYRNYVQFGWFKYTLLPAFNFALTDPPSDVYVSHPPLMAVIMGLAAAIFGDRGATYSLATTILNAAIFVLLAIFATRRWGRRVGVWTLFFSLFCRSALLHGDTQAFEQLGLIGMFPAIFLYFEWLEKGNSRTIFFGLIFYAIGFAGTYLAFFGALVIVAHWLIFSGEKSRQDLLRVSVFAIWTILFTALMIALMLHANVPLTRWFARAQHRFGDTTWLNLARTLKIQCLELVGYPLFLAATGYVARQYWLRFRNGSFEGPNDIAALHCLFFSGFLPVFIFKDWSGAHAYTSMFLVPFFAVAGALVTEALWARISNRSGRAVLAVSVAVVFLSFSTDRGRLVAGRLWDKGNRSHVVEIEPKVAPLAQSVRSSIRSNDRLLILYKGTDWKARMAAFHELWIPTAESQSVDDWQRAVRATDWSILLATDSESMRVARAVPNLSVLAVEGDVGFFRRTRSSW